VQQGPAGAVERAQKWLRKAATGACKRAPTFTAHPDLHLQCTQCAPKLCPCAQQARMRPQRLLRGGRSSDGQPSPPSPSLPPAPQSMAHSGAWEHVDHPWLGPGAIERGGRSPLALQASPRFHPSRREGPCPPPPRSHPAHPPTVQPQLLRAGPQGDRGQVGACCGQRALRNPIPAATPHPCGHLAARTLPLPTHPCPHGVGAAQMHQLRVVSPDRAQLFVRDARRGKVDFTFLSGLPRTDKIRPKIPDTRTG